MLNRYNQMALVSLYKIDLLAIEGVLIFLGTHGAQWVKYLIELTIHTTRVFSYEQWNHHVASLIHARHSRILSYVLNITFIPFYNPPFNFSLPRFDPARTVVPVICRYSAICKIWKRPVTERSK